MIAGSPPRVRGKVKIIWFFNGFRGITPAYAGKRPTAKGCSSGSRDYPSVCGEKTPDASSTTKSIGSPPRMRGKAKRHVADDGMIGITPAYAGKSEVFGYQEAWAEDHPRVCGEKVEPNVFSFQIRGSPPRVRGKEGKPNEQGLLTGITPACAGKRRKTSSDRTRATDHPRVCGEKSQLRCAAASCEGSPPRVRGKVRRSRNHVPRTRITPACAGKSWFPAVTLMAKLDHPRVCGEKTKKIP